MWGIRTTTLMIIRTRKSFAVKRRECSLNLPRPGWGSTFLVVMGKIAIQSLHGWWYSDQRILVSLTGDFVVITTVIDSVGICCGAVRNGWGCVLAGMWYGVSISVVCRTPSIA